jgi:hypothetical protein
VVAGSLVGAVGLVLASWLPEVKDAIRYRMPAVEFGTLLWLVTIEGVIW